MEMKAVCEYKEPEYVTRDDGRSKVFKFVMNCKKVSLGVFAMLLLWSNEVMAAPIFVSTNELEPQLVGSVVSFVPTLFHISVWAVTMVLLLSAIVIFIKNSNVESEDKKNRLKKRCKACVIWALVFALVGFLGPLFIDFIGGI